MKPSNTWCLHEPDWPQGDRDLWKIVFRGKDWLDDAGSGFHLSPKTQEKYAENYGHWLAWLSDHGFVDFHTAPTERVTRDRISAYAKWMQGKVAPVTARMRVEDLCAVMRLFDPFYDTGVLREVLVRMPKTPSRDKRKGLKDPGELTQLGMNLMETAQAGEFGPPRYNAVSYRDGLLIALCASRPLRRSNLAGLKIGDHLQCVDNGVRIVIPSEQTKASAAINVTWPSTLLLPLQQYLDHWRPILLGNYPDQSALWISGRGGGPLSAHTIGCNFRRHTKEAFESAIGPHRFRDSAATFMAIHDPANVRVAAAVLGHKSYQSTQKHYNLACQLDAASTLQKNLDSLLEDE